MISKLQADKLVEEFETFYCKETTINETKIFIYNYILSDKKAFAANNNLGAELRGLTITRENAKERVFLSCPKFFNINEIEENTEDNLKLKKIKKVQGKLDGSLIQPIQINGEVIMKSKQSFTNQQAKLAQSILDDSADLKYFIMDCWDNNFFPLFELTGPNNIVVVDYPHDELTLIAVRNEKGEFIDVDKFSYKYTAPSYDMTLDEIIDDAYNKTGIEGYVVKFTDGSIVKVKTIDYITKHKLTNESNSFKLILKRILDETIDDVLSIIPDNKRDKIKEYDKLVTNYVVHYIKQIEDIVSEEISRKELANKYKTHEYFNVIMSCSDGRDIKEYLITYLLKKYNKEHKAKKFISSI